MRYFSEIYHESTQYIPHGSGDPVIMHWEKQAYADKRFDGCERYPLTAGFMPLLAPISADFLKILQLFTNLNFMFLHHF